MSGRRRSPKAPKIPATPWPTAPLGPWPDEPLAPPLNGPQEDALQTVAAEIRLRADRLIAAARGLIQAGKTVLIEGAIGPGHGEIRLRVSDAPEQPTRH